MHRISQHHSYKTTSLRLIYPGHELQWQEKSPDPWQMGKGRHQQIQREEYTIDGHLEMLYMRKTQAEIERGYRTQ